MNNHPNAPGFDHDTGEVDDAEVLGEILDPISTNVLATIQRVEIDQQIATAKQYPRNVTKLKAELTALVTMDEDTADDCIYALPRGKNRDGSAKHIKGPSARFADALISYWGNARSGAFVVQVNREEKFIEAIGHFQDVERNVIRQRRVRRTIAGRDGSIYNGDMINMTGNAACVIAERNAILNGIPKSLWSGAYEQAFALVAGTTKTLTEKLSRAEKHFMAIGISMEQVLEKIGRPDISKVVPDDIVTMRGMITALKTGEETVEVMFGRGAGSTHDKVASPLKDEAPARDRVRGNIDTVNRADRVVKADGTVIKDRDNDTGGQLTGEQMENARKDPGTVVLDSEGRPEAARKAVQQPSEEKVPEADRGQNNASAADASGSAGAGTGGPYDMTPASYMAYVRGCFDAAKVKSAVTEVWGATRADRNNLLDADQVDELTKDKEATLKRIKLKGEG